MPFFGPPNVEKMKAKRDINGLVAAFHYHEADTIQKAEYKSIRSAAARALGELGWQPPNRTERARLAAWLEQWDVVAACGQDAYEPLFSYYKEANDTTRQTAILRVFGEIGDPRVIPYLDSYFHYDGPVRKAALRALCLISMKQPGDGLNKYQFVRRFKNREDELQIELFQVLAEIGGEQAASALMIFAEEVTSALQYETSPVTQAFMRSLARLENSAIEPLRVALSQENVNVYVRMVAIRVLKQIKNEQAFSVLRDALHDSRFQGPSQEIEKAIAAYGGANAVRELLNSLGSRDARISFHKRRDAADALATMRDPGAVPQLVEFLTDEREEVRRIAASTLGALGDPRAIAPLVDRYQQETPQNRYASAHALAMLNCPAGIGYFVDALYRPNDPSTSDRDIVVALLEKAAAQVSEADLQRIAALTDPQHTVSSYDEWTETTTSGIAHFDLSKPRLLARQELARRGQTHSPF